MLSYNCSKTSSHLFINIQLGQFTVSHTRQTLEGGKNQDKIFLQISLGEGVGLILFCGLGGFLQFEGFLKAEA